MAGARGGKPEEAVASAFPRPPCRSPSQAHPLGIPPGYGTLWSSGRGRLLGGPRFLYAHRPFAVLARGSSLAESPPRRPRPRGQPTVAPGPLDSLDGSPAGQVRKSKKRERPQGRPRVAYHEAPCLSGSHLEARPLVVGTRRASGPCPCTRRGGAKERVLPQAATAPPASRLAQGQKRETPSRTALHDAWRVL